MKKNTAIVLISIFVCLLFSCSHGFLKDPRLYNTKKKTNNVIVVAPEPELQLTGGVDPFDDENVWYNDPNEGFPHTDFETMSLVGTYFNDDNVPVYAMESGEVWAIKDASKNEFIHAKAPNTSGQGYAISNVNWYQYRGKNPLYAADGSYNTTLQLTSNLKPKLSRFYFYRFTGDTLSPSLDNFLFAVDTYSKLMFAFAYPTKTENVFGNNVPKAWGPTDGSAFLGTNYQFYMYDPVGYVEKKEGKYTVVMYDWFKQNLTKGIYQPTLGGLDDKSQGTALTTVASKTSDGAGTSPFNNHTVDFFSKNIELLLGETFQQREKVEDGYGLVLYKYIVEKNGEKIVIRRTAESWNGLPTDEGTDLKDKIYTISKKDDESGSATKGLVTLENGESFDFELTDVSRTITFSNGERATRNFNDPGPDWLFRVRGQTYIQPDKTVDDGYSYSFSEDGKTVTFRNPNAGFLQQEEGTYTFAQQDAGNRAVYKQQDSVYWGLKLDENDQVLYSTGTSWGTAGSTPSSSASEWKSLIKHDATGLTSFTDAVKGLEFSYRETNDCGNDLSLMTLKFSADGKKVTLYETIWGKSKVATSTKDVDVVDGESKTTGTIGGTEVTLTLPETGSWTLEYEGKTYFLGFNDEGPSFVNRVKYNPVYVSDDGKTVYRFSDNGKTMRMTSTGDTYLGFITVGNFDYVYNFEELVNTDDKNTSRAIYGSKDALLYYAGFELSESDMLIKASKTSGAGTGTFAWDMTHAARRDANTGGIPTEEDLNYFYESMKNKSFYTRNVENGVAGLDLLTWRFEEGRAVKHTKQTWLSDTTEPVVSFPEEAKLVATSRKSGTIMLENGTRYTFTLNDSADSVLVETSMGKSGTTSLTYYLNYDDKGPGFINRVKGKTYKNDTWTYIFDKTGETMTAIKNGNSSGDTYTYKNAEKKESLYEISAAYYGPYVFGSFGRIWGFKLTDQDRTLASSSAAMADVNSILGVSYSFTYQPTTLVE